MTKRKRTILFLTMVALFFLIAPAIVFHSQGYRFDFQKKIITQVGGIFIKTHPKQAEIYLDQKLVQKTDFFFGSVLIKNLLPKSYAVEIKKEGFLSWRKTMEVRPKEVAEAKGVVLFPSNVQFASITKTANDFWISPDGKKIIIYEPAANKTMSWGLKLYSLETNIKSHLIFEKDISSKGADLMNLEWSPGSKEAYLYVGTKEQEKKFVLKIDNTSPLLKEAASDTLSEDEIYYLDDAGYLFKQKTKLSQTPFPIKQETEYKLREFSAYLFLQEDKTLYLFNKNSGIFEKFFDGLESIKISPDKKKLVFSSNSEIWLFYLQDILISPERKAGEKLFLARFSEKIGNVLWLNPDYLIFNAGEKIIATETNSRDRIQLWNIASFPDPEISFSESDKKLYVLSSNSLYQSEPLLK
ncbi:MAG: PEGA domain-containing protein [bacterium]